jgi:hypothetical protein
MCTVFSIIECTDFITGIVGVDTANREGRDFFAFKDIFIGDLKRVSIFASRN